ncbi:hypothetical protein [Yonghaparkia sp. Root332]|uniref:hypothetical protein n=1 Tax=Yonghaparkia sp. Root332 TaxID=1736516 RepID=UPI0006F75CB2|nr:hypothetical protein [Yonghaparkia sp. Root332]KQV24500.1 hypothetical protein ASC54_08105 [Yonghaparkia sp. Root332]
MTTRSARRRALHRIGVLALSSLSGAAVGLVGSATHQSLPPVGIALALVTTALLLSGLRAWGDDRGPAVAGAFGLGSVALALATPGAGGSVLIPGNPLGYGWTLGIMLIALVVLAWPRIQRTHRRPAGSIEPTAPDQKDPSAP